MSFSADVKTELCRAGVSRRCCALSEAYGALLFCNTFTSREIRIVTESRAFAARLPKLFRRAFSLGFELQPLDPCPPGKLVFAITDEKNVERIFSAYGYDSSKLLAHHINLGMLEEECCRASFLRGAFLAGGSVTDPGKRYHLELVTDHYNVSREVFSILLDMGFAPKDVARGGNYVVYFKQSEAIEDVLTKLGAPVSAMEIMSAKVEKDLRNTVNRRVNCEAANVEKTAFAALDQVRAIEKLRRGGKLETLPEKLRETAQMRLDNPETSLAELAALFDPPLTKSCLNHRLRKLAEIAK